MRNNQLKRYAFALQGALAAAERTLNLPESPRVDVKTAELATLLSSLNKRAAMLNYKLLQAGQNERVDEITKLLKLVRKALH